MSNDLLHLPQTPSAHPRACNLLAGKCHPVLSFSRRNNWLLTEQLRKITHFGAALDDEFGRKLPNSFLVWSTFILKHPQMNTGLRGVKLEKAEQLYTRNLTYFTYLPLGKETVLLTGM